MKQNLLLQCLQDYCLPEKKIGNRLIRITLALALLLTGVIGVGSIDSAVASEGDSQKELTTSQAQPPQQIKTPAEIMEVQAAYEAQEYVRVRTLVEPLAETWHPQAMYVWGYVLRKGQGGALDEDLGWTWTLRSARENYVPAMLALAKDAVDKPKGEQNWQKGCRWLKGAANNGDLGSMMATAGCYLDGRGASGTPQDLVQSLAWFIAAEREGIADATRFRKNIEGVLSDEDITLARVKGATLGVTTRSKNNSRPGRNASERVKPLWK